MLVLRFLEALDDLQCCYSVLFCCLLATVPIKFELVAADAVIPALTPMKFEDDAFTAPLPAA